MTPDYPMRHVILILLTMLAGSATDTVALAADSRQPSVQVRTGKERLGDKGTDEQRSDDCKVPAARRTKARPAGCGGAP